LGSERKTIFKNPILLLKKLLTLFS